MIVLKATAKKGDIFDFMFVIPGDQYRLTVNGSNRNPFYSLHLENVIIRMYSNLEDILDDWEILSYKLPKILNKGEMELSRQLREMKISDILC